MDRAAAGLGQSLGAGIALRVSMQLFTDQFEMARVAPPKPKAVSWFGVGLWFLVVFGLTTMALSLL